MRSLQAVFALLQSYSLSVLFSSATPFDIQSVISSTGLHSHEIACAQITNLGEVVLAEGEMVLDYLYDEGLSSLVRSSRDESCYYRMWGSEGNSQYLHTFAEYMQALNFSKALLLGDTEHQLSVVPLAVAYPLLFQDFTIVPKDLTLDFALQYIGKHIKSKGINLLALFLNAQATYTFLQALQIKKLDRVGYAFLLSQSSGRYRYLSNSTFGLLGNGVLVVGSEAEQELSRERLEARLLREWLDCNMQSCYGNSNWFLFFTRENTLVKAASSPSEVSKSSSITFPGNTTEFPHFSYAQIHAFVNYPLNNPDGSRYPLAATIMRGFQLAFEEANNRTDLLPFYYLIDQSVDFTGTRFDFNASIAKVKATRDSPGLIYMPPPISSIVIGMSKVFNSLNISMPITTGSLSSQLSDTKAYPFFARACSSTKYICTIMARMVKYFGWSKVAFLYGTDSSDMYDIYQSFRAVQDLFGINITNSETQRALPALLNEQTIGTVNASLQAIIHSNTRVIIIAHHYFFVIMEQLYDLGVREGYVLLFVSGLSDAVYKDKKYYKRRVVSKGALQFFPRLFKGKVGRAVQQELIKRDGMGIFSNTCLYYDSAYLYFYATDYLVDQGHDYEDPFEIMHAMRDTHFHGCSGLVKVEADSNDRADAEIVITNFRYYSENDTYELREVGSFNPFSAQPYQFTSTIQWPDDGLAYADTKPQYQDCSFLAESVKDVAVLKNIGVFVLCGVVLYTFALVVLFYRVWRKKQIEPLSTAKPIQVEDVLVFFSLLCETFQLAALGPEFTEISSLLMTICDTLGVFTVFEGDEYWTVLNVALGVMLLWSVICMIDLIGLESRMCSCYRYWTKLLMPALSNFLFLPLVSLLSGAFMCSKGISESLTESFFDKDCREFCWRGKHMGYAAGSAAALIIYLPLAVGTRPLWQERQSIVHVKATPLALLVKSVIQVVLIASSLILKEKSPSTHAYINHSILTCYLSSLLVLPGFNYPRLNLWQFLLTVALLSLSVATHISALLEHTSLVLLGEYALLGVLGVIVQTCLPVFKSRLVREKGKDLRGLFVFAFTGGQRAQAGLERYYAANHIEHPSATPIDILIEIPSLTFPT